MNTTPPEHAGPRTSQQGQVLMLFVLFVTVLLLTAALLVDAGQALVRRRQLQDAADSAALAASHQVPPDGCLGSSGSVRSQVSNSARASLMENLAGVPGYQVNISCPAGWGNYAVTVEVSVESPSFFLGAASRGPFMVSAKGSAVNGPVAPTKRSVIVLDRTACSAFSIHGNGRVLLSGSLQVNSSCSAAAGGALYINGNSGYLSAAGGTFVTGGVVAPAGAIAPAPLTGQAATPDPFSGLPPVPPSGLPVRSNARLTVSTPRLLEPGVYRGGLEIKARTLMNPGIYFIEGGGVAMGGGAELLSVNTGVTVTGYSSAPTWTTQCTAGSCGVLIYNTSSASHAMGPIEATAGGIAKLRGYEPRVDPHGGFEDYRNLVLWQAGSSTVTASQPTIAFRGNTSFTLLGGVYAPQATMRFDGNTDGTYVGVGATSLFVVRRFETYGGIELNLAFDSRIVPARYDYGLIE
jgi:hypothetical protein